MDNKINKLAIHTGLPSILFTSKTDEYSTPQPLFDRLNLSFAFTLDPCASSINYKCSKYFTIEDDGLNRPWAGERVFMNPPYSAVNKWIEKAYRESQEADATVVCLVASRTDTRWWQDYVLNKANEVCFLAGRITFGTNDGKPANTAPFPSALVIYRPPILRSHTRPPKSKAILDTKG